MENEPYALGFLPELDIKLGRTSNTFRFCWDLAESPDTFYLMFFSAQSSISGLPPCR